MTHGAPRSRPRASWRDRHADPSPPEELPPKLGHSLREFFSTAAALIHTRVALAGIELEEEIQRLLSAGILVAIIMVAGFMALLVGTFTIVIAVPAEYRVGTMIGITALYAVVAVVLALRLKAVFEGRPPIFGATLAEIEKDKEIFTKMTRARHVAEADDDRARDGEEAAFAQVRPAEAPAPSSTASPSPPTGAS